METGHKHTEMYVPMHLNEEKTEYHKQKNAKWKYKVLLDRLKDDSDYWKNLNQFFQYYFISDPNLENQYRIFFDKLLELENKSLHENIQKLRSLE